MSNDRVVDFSKSDVSVDDRPDCEETAFPVLNVGKSDESVNDRPDCEETALLNTDPVFNVSKSDESVKDLPAIIELQSFQESELSEFAALAKATALTATSPFSTFKRGFIKKKSTLNEKKRRRTSRLKSIIRAGMATNRINNKKGKIAVVHEDHSHGHDKYMFHPLKTFKQVWDITTSIFVLWLVGKVPLTLGFSYWYYKGDAMWIHYFDIFLDIYFWVDMLFMFNSGFVHDGHVVMTRKESAKHYFEFWFWVDIIAQLPYEHMMTLSTMIFAEEGQQREAKLVRKTVKLIKFFKLAKLLRLGTLVRTLQKHGKYYKTVVFMLVFMMSLHLGACVLVAVADPCGALDDPGLSDADQYKRFKVYLDDGYKGLCSQGNIPVLYFDALHLSMAMLLGNSIEDIPSQITAHVWDQPEQAAGLDVLATVYMLIGLCLFGSVVAVITNIIIHSDANSWTFHAEVANVKAEIAQLHLPKPLAYRVQRHYDYLWLNRRNYDHHFLDDGYMSSHLKRDILLHFYRPFFHSSRLFAHAVTDEIIFKMAKNFNLEINLPDEQMFTVGELADRCYLILKGRVKLYLEHREEHGSSTSLTMGQGKLLGAYEIVECSPFQRTAITVTVCELMSLTRLSFLDALRGHDLALNKLKERVKHRRGMNIDSHWKSDKTRNAFSSVRQSLTKRNLRMRKFAHKLNDLNKHLAGLKSKRSNVNANWRISTSDEENFRV